ncbi:hypothetical protein K440DRAFT_643380 [Wilcoxina mikolae CBS 423.85]|nr:hypothetical protein K440DRAFT_643380 [Wilcoxina mikolae CBS 423.85]
MDILSTPSLSRNVEVPPFLGSLRMRILVHLLEFMIYWESAIFAITFITALVIGVTALTLIDSLPKFYFLISTLFVHFYARSQVPSDPRASLLLSLRMLKILRKTITHIWSFLIATLDTGESQSHNSPVSVAENGSTGFPILWSFVRDAVSTSTVFCGLVTRFLVLAFRIIIPIAIVSLLLPRPGTSEKLSPIDGRPPLRPLTQCVPCSSVSSGMQSIPPFGGPFCIFVPREVSIARQRTRRYLGELYQNEIYFMRNITSDINKPSGLPKTLSLCVQRYSGILLGGPNLTQRSSSGLRWWIHGCYDLVFADNGSERNIVRKDYALRRGIVIDMSPQACTKVPLPQKGKFLFIIGKATLVSWDFEDNPSQVYHLDFDVVSNCVHDVIIGNQFLSQMGTLTDYNYRLVAMPLHRGNGWRVKIFAWEFGRLDEVCTKVHWTFDTLSIWAFCPFGPFGLFGLFGRLAVWPFGRLAVWPFGCLAASKAWASVLIPGQRLKHWPLAASEVLTSVRSSDQSLKYHPADSVLASIRTKLWPAE